MLAHAVEPLAVPSGEPGLEMPGIALRGRLGARVGQEELRRHLRKQDSAALTFGDPDQQMRVYATLGEP